MSRKGCVLYLALLIASLLAGLFLSTAQFGLKVAMFKALVPEAGAAEEPLPKSSETAAAAAEKQREDPPGQLRVSFESASGQLRDLGELDNSQSEPDELQEDPEDFENEKIEQALLTRAHRIDNCRITYYCCERYAHICGTGDGLTALGGEVTPGVSCAVPKPIPLGSTIMIDWGDGSPLEYRRGDDRGDAVRGDHIDLAVPSHREALELGVRRATVYWTEEEL